MGLDTREMLWADHRLLFVKAFRILLIMITLCSFGIWLFLPNNKPVNLTDLTKKEIVELANGDTLVGHGFFRLPSVLKSIGAKVCIASGILAAGVSGLLRRGENRMGYMRTSSESGLTALQIYAIM